MTTNDKPVRPVDFFATHPVFNLDEFAAAHREGRDLKPEASQAVLKQHVHAGHLIRVRRGLYAVVPRGVPPEAAPSDPVLLASRAAPDAVIAYHSALQLHGKAYSVSRRFTYLTQTKSKPFQGLGAEFLPVAVPATLRRLPDLGGGIIEVRRSGLTVRVTTLERTLVDVLDAPRYGGGWEEIWRSLESVEFFDVDAVTDYALKLGSAATIAKVGFYLEQHREPLMLEDEHLERLRRHAPRQALYLERSKRESGTLVKGWNLIVPDRVLQQSWAEVS